MEHEFASANGPSDVPGISLYTVWKVNADESYDVTRHDSIADSERIRRYGGTGNIAIYTASGSGRLYWSDGLVAETSEETLVLTSFRDIRRYHTRGSKWSFWWFEFGLSGTITAPSNQALKLGNDNDSQILVKQIYSDLRSERADQRRVATSTFSMLLHRWIADWHGEYTIAQKTRTVYAAIDRIHQDIYRPWRVSELARDSGMSLRSFGDAFATTTGMTPKQFLTRLRLEMASELLRLGVMNVSEAANRFGFSSPYHFSNAYSRHFGHRPSQTKP